MSILSRYLLRNYLASFFLCLGVFLFILLMNYFLRLFNLAVMKGISLGWIFFCFTRLLPFFLSMALPMAFLVSLLLTLGAFSESGEVLALRSSGFSFREILAPFFAVALLVSGALFFVNHRASPDGFHSFKNSHAEVLAQVSRLELEPSALTRMGDWEMFSRAVEAEPDADSGTVGQSLSGVRLVKREGSYKRLRVAAPRGRMRIESGRGVSLELEAGSLIWPSKDPESHTDSTFGRYRLFVPFVDYKKVHRNPDLQELNTPRLRERLDGYGLREDERLEYLTEATLRSAGAAAPFVLLWVACPLGLGLEKRGRAKGFALSLGLMFAFYGLMALGVGLGRRDVVWAWLGPWLPDAACLAVGVGLWWRQLRR